MVIEYTHILTYHTTIVLTIISQTSQNSDRTKHASSSNDEEGGIKTVEATHNNGWMGGIVDNLNNWKSGFGKKLEIQTVL